jgi:hypothetical protein
VISNLLKVMPSNLEQSGRVSRGRNGHPSADDWEKHKAEIVSLYEEQDKSLDEVVRLMEAKHHFTATYAVPSQFTIWIRLTDQGNLLTRNVFRTGESRNIPLKR